MPATGELTDTPLTPTPGADDRRERQDRRGQATAGRRGKAKSRNRRIAALVGDLGAIVVLVAAIVFAVNHARPIFAGQPTVVQSLTERVPITKPILTPTAPPDTGRLAALMASPQFAADSAAFSEDLVRTGRMKQERADSIAFYAVREAYQRGIPPAVIFGVMLTENAVFVSNALSNVGAIGLMQVYPKIWLKELGDKFGTDLASDSTNLKYGVYILSEYIKPKRGSETVTASDVQKGLLRYNGCVKGTNTPNCKTYPTKVKNYVERQAESLCGDKTFYQCVAKPFMDGLLGRSVASTH
ncbi:MAG TPA: lytic transglycosylase domain-containing protein [Gemmatimonadaceae bacterium]|nr:lytic transglycosylase domain-containing protein [Gemmatimonadaceae bacterium]